MALYYYKDPENKITGPLSELQMIYHREAGRMQDDSPVCEADREAWRCYSDFEFKRPPEMPTRKYMTMLGFALAGFVIVFAIIYGINYEMDITAGSPVVLGSAFAPREPMVPPIPPLGPHSPPVTPVVMTKYDAAIKVAEQRHPDLAAEDEEIRKDLMATSSQFDAEVAQVSPELKSIVDRLSQVQDNPEHRLAIDLKYLSPDEAQKLANARSQVVLAHPELTLAWVQIIDRARTFQHKLDLATVLVDPGLAPYISGIEAHVEPFPMLNPPSSQRD